MVVLLGSAVLYALTPMYAVVAKPHKDYLQI